ncbi:hypothetical protein SDC9_173570 [bioreactor metagenome]|uniref:Uncharacterized protein n=1 Tax=bioreactor metagenome TaxID=1076179 RepID=A0A645GIT8_9ZZZZ
MGEHVSDVLALHGLIRIRDVIPGIEYLRDVALELVLLDLLRVVGKTFELRVCRGRAERLFLPRVEHLTCRRRSPHKGKKRRIRRADIGNQLRDVRHLCRCVILS